MVKGKSAKGRKKIEMKAILNEDTRQVCFSKRRPSLFNKANELSILCSAEVAAVVFSPGGKSFSFGHPSVDSVVDHFLPMGINDEHAIGGEIDPTAGNVSELNQQLADLQMLMGAEKKKKEKLQQKMEKESGNCIMKWFNSNARDLGIDELEEFQKELVALKGMINGRLYHMLQEAKETNKPPTQSNMEETSTAPFTSGGKSIMSSDGN